MKDRSSAPSPALLIAMVALLAALSSTAIALPGKNSVDKNDVAKDAIRAKQIKDATVGSAELADGGVQTADLGDGAVGTAKITDASVNSAKIADRSVALGDTAIQWALVDGDGSILDQSGGIAALHVGNGDYYVNFGANANIHSIQVTTAPRPGDGGYGVSANAGLCGGAPLGVACNDPASNDANHVVVGTTNHDGTGNNQGFYITVY
jgi:hypothetical protein